MPASEGAVRAARASAREEAVSGDDAAVVGGDRYAGGARRRAALRGTRVSRGGVEQADSRPEGDRNAIAGTAETAASIVRATRSPVAAVSSASPS